MSNSPRPIPKGYGGKSDDEQDSAPVVFPPLMSTLDVYVDASAEQRYHQVVDKVKAAGKKKTSRKVKKKTPQSNAIHMEPLAALVDVNRPESRLPSSKESPRGQFHLRDYSSGDREDYYFDSLSLESAPKRGPSDRKIHISSPPPSSDRKQMSSRPNFTPYSPARILVQPASSQSGFNYKNPQLSPTEGGSPGGHTVQTHTSSAYHNAPLKSDLGFGQAVQSIAAIKLHNFAMKRRDHVSQKLKLLREIRGFEKENNADMVVAQKLRKDEVLAAWKIRYYIEYLRLNSVRHIVEHTTQKNIELEDECSLLQQSAAVAEIENESLSKEIARLSTALSENNTISGATTAALSAQVQDLTYQLQASRRDTAEGGDHARSLQQAINQLEQALAAEKHQVEVLQTELGITRLTCQELVRAGGQKDGEIADLSHELQTLRSQHASTQEQLLHTQSVHRLDLERAAMREEDNQIKYQKTSLLHASLHDRERTIRTYETDFNNMAAEVAALQTQLSTTTTQLAAERASIGGIEQEKSGLQKLLSELAKRLTQADEDKVKSIAAEKSLKSDLKSANHTIATQAHTIQDLESQLSAAHDEIEFLVEENHELGREIECHHMFGEEMNQRYMVCFTNAERSLEYSRFLEEELFCARKLYEKSSAHYHDIHNNNNMGSSNHNNITAMFGDVSEESYGYRNSAPGGHQASHGGNHRSYDENGEFGGNNDGAEGPNEGRTSPGRPKSNIEQLTGLEPVQPLVIHLNSFSRGVRSSSRQGRNEFDRPNSASMYNPDSRPQSTNANNSSIMAEQRLLMVLNTLEEKMKNVDRAADSLRYLAEKADAIEKVQSSTQNILNAHNTAAALARQPVRLSVLREQQAAEKNALIEKHINMERVFSEMHASSDQVNAALNNNQRSILQLQDRRAECKETISGMKRRIKKSRKASLKDPSAVFLTENEEAETESTVASLTDEMDALKEQINTLKEESVNINAQSIALQTELYHLDQELEKSATAFFNAYSEHITAYYPPELAHLIEDNHIEEHGRYTIQAPLELQLNTLYETEEDDLSSVNNSVHKLRSSSTGTGMGQMQMQNSTSMTSGVESGVALEHSVFESAHTLHTLHSLQNTNTEATLEDVSELESPFLLDSPSPSKTKKAKKSSKSRKNSEFNPSEGGFNPPLEQFSPSSRERKSSKMHKLAKSKSKSRKNRAKSDSFGDFEESGMDLEEGSSGTVDPDFSVNAQGNLGTASENGMGLSLDRNDSVYNVPNMRGEHASDSPAVRKVVCDTSAHDGGGNNTNHILSGSAEGGSLSNDATPRWNSPLNYTNYTSSMHSAPYSPPYSPQSQYYSSNPSAYASSANTSNNTNNNTTANTAYSTAYNTTFNTPSPSRGRPHNEADRTARQQQALAREHLAQLRAEIESAIVNLDACLDTIEQYEFNRSEIRSNIVRWVQQYTALCGYVPTVEDKLRSLTLQPLLHTYHSIQADLQLAHTKALTIATTATTLRTKLLTEQHSQHSQHATLPIQQLEEPLTLLYPISSVEQVYMEDPLLIPGDEELQAMQDGGSMVSELSASLQGSLTFPNTNEANNTTYYIPTHYGSASGGGVTDSEGGVQGVRAEQPAEDAVSFAKSEKKARKAAKKAAKREKSGKYLENSFGLGTSGTAGDDSSVNSIDEDSVVSAGGGVHGSISGGGGTGGGNGIVDTYGFDADPNYHATYNAYNAGTNATTGAGTSNSNSSYYSVPTTPYATQLGVWNHDAPGFTASQEVSSDATHPTLTLTGNETLSFLLAEEKRLKKELRVWNMNFTTTHGRKPLPTDFDDFSEDVKNKLYSKSLISTKLAGLGYRSGKYTGASADASASAGVNDTSTTSGVVRPKSRGTETEPIPEHTAIHHPAPTNTINPATAATANTTNTFNTTTTDNSSFSVPTTPYTDRLSTLQIAFTTTDFTAMKFNKSSKFASLFADTSVDGTINTDALLHEQSVLKNELRVWAVEYSQMHNKKPLPSDYDTFSTEIKAKIYRKNYIKRVLQEHGVNDGDSVVSGASGAYKGAGSSASGVYESPTGKWRAKQLAAGNSMESAGEVNGGDVGRDVIDSGLINSAAANAATTTDTSDDVFVDNTTHTPYDINTDTNLYATTSTTTANADGDSQFSFSLPNTPFTRVRKSMHSATADGDVGDVVEIADSDAAGGSLDVYGTSAINDNADTTGPAPDTAAYAALYTTTITDLYDSVASGTITVESLLQEQNTLRSEIRAWTQEFIQIHHKRPSVEDFDSFDTELKLKLIRKNQLKKLLLEYGISSSVSRKYGNSGDMGSVEAELTEEQIEAVRTGRPTSREFTAGRSSRGSSRGREGTSSRGNSRSRGDNSNGTSGGTSSKSGSRSNKRNRAVNNTNTDNSAGANADPNTSTSNTTDYSTPVVDNIDSIYSEPAESLPTVTPDTNKARRNKNDTAVDSGGVSISGTKDANADAMRMYDISDYADNTAGISLDAYTMSILHPTTTTINTTSDMGGDVDNERVSTAQSNSSMYSVPTTPYANHLATLDGTENTNTANNDYDDGNSMYDQSIRLPNTTYPNTTYTTDPTSHNAITNTNADLDYELKTIKKDLRRWNVTFMRQNGRLPGPDDFDLFDEEVKLKLVRKKQLQVLIGRRDSVFEGMGGMDGIEGKDSVEYSGTGNSGSGSGSGDANTTTAVDDGAAANINADTGGTSKRGRSPSRSQNRSSDPSASTTTANTFVNTYANIGAAADPNVGGVSSASGASGVIGSASIFATTTDTNTDTATNTNLDTASSIDITPFTAELAQIKTALKDWHSHFVATHGREPAEEDLTQDIVELGTRRSELKAYIASVKGGKSSRGSSRGGSRGGSGGNSRAGTADSVSGKGRSKSSRGASAMGLSVDTDTHSSNIDTSSSIAATSGDINTTLLSPTKPTTPSSGSSRPRHSKAREVTADSTSGDGASGDGRVEYTGSISATSSNSPTNYTTNTHPTSTTPNYGTVDRTGLSSPKGPKRVSFINHNTSDPNNSSTSGANVTSAGGNSDGSSDSGDGTSGVFEVPLTPHPTKTKHHANPSPGNPSPTNITTASGIADTETDHTPYNEYPINTTTHNTTNNSSAFYDNANANKANTTNTHSTLDTIDALDSDYPKPDTPINITELSKEYSKIKKALKRWQREFVEIHNREPVDEDFDHVDASLQELIVRKFELKQLLGDNTQSVKVKEPKEPKEPKEGKEGKESKKSKKNKSEKSGRYDYQDSNV